MLQLTKHDLIFLSRLDVDLELHAVLKQNEGAQNKKDYWTLQVTTQHDGFKQTGILHGARGEIRKFLQLNALVRACKDYIPGCDRIILHV